MKRTNSRTFSSGAATPAVFAALAFATVACGREAPAAPSHAPPVATANEADLAVLPNNTSIYCTKEKLVAIRSDGEIAWELPFTDGDTAIAPVAVAANSVAYVRGRKALHAAQPDGKWLWSKPLEGQASAKSRAANAPVSLSDSTVAVVVGDDVIRFDMQGAVRWRVTIPEGHVNNRPASGMDGSVLVPSTAGLYSVDPAGKIAWRRVIGG
jgi:outer membrane protein assembly factor BamB